MKKIEYYKIDRDIYCLYIYFPKDDEDWFKVGECHTGVFLRGLSNDYWTVQKNDGRFVTFFTYKKIDKKEIMRLEKMLIELCQENTDKGDAGREVFILKKEKKWSSTEEVISKIKDFISEKCPIFDSYFENKVSEIRKIMKYKIKNLTSVVDYEIINNDDSTCFICDKPLKNMHRVLIKVDDLEIKIDIGKDCFKKHCQNDNILKKQNIRKVGQCFSKIKKKMNTKKCSELDFVDDESVIIDSDDESVVDSDDESYFDLFYNRFSSNSGFPKKDIIKLEFDLNSYNLDILKKYILWGALSYFFAEKGSFSLELNNEMLEYIKNILYDKYNDNCKKYSDSIDKYLVLLSISSYPEVFSIEGDNIKFIHTKLIDLIENFKDLLQSCESIKVDIKNLLVKTYSNEQLKALNNNKFVTGVPGGGKSKLITEKINSITTSKQCFVLFTPTHSSKDELLKNDIHDDNVVKVIHSLSEGYTNYLLKVKYKNRNEINLIIDEFSMFDINHWYKITYFLDICLKSKKKVFIFITGDPYQLKPIHFSNETDVFTSFISKESLELRKTHRGGGLNNIIENKTELTNDRLQLIYKDKYKEGSNDDLNKIIEDELIAYEKNNEEISVYITPTNRIVNSINNSIYENKKKQNCENCPRDLRVGDLYYCDNCLHMFDFRVCENKAYTKSKLCEDKLLLKIGNIEEKLSSEDFSKIQNNTTSIITTINNNKIIINKFSASIIFINNNTTYYLRNSNSKNYDLISYNGEKYTIKKTEKDMYILSNNIKTHYVTRSFITDSKICLSYAETTHKSQGRTYGKTIFILEEDRRIDCRNIYVGTTRFKTKLVVFKIKGSEISSNNTESLENNKKQEISYDYVGDWICELPKGKGRTYNEILEYDRTGYLIWLHQNYKKLDFRIKKWIENKII